jgi:hypothetical protein
MARAGLSPAEVDKVWRRWRSGLAVKALARQMRLNPSTVRDVLKRTGGIRPVPRLRWQLRLDLGEREEISRGLANGKSLRSIAARRPHPGVRPCLSGRPRSRPSGRWPKGLPDRAGTLATRCTRDDPAGTAAAKVPVKARKQ